MANGDASPRTECDAQAGREQANETKPIEALSRVRRLEGKGMDLARSKQENEMTRGKRTLRTVVADSRNLFRRGLSTLIAAEADMAMVGEASSAAEALAKIAPHGSEQPGADVLVIDIALLRADAEAVATLRTASKAVAIMLLAPNESDEHLEMTVAAGARGYKLRDTPPAQLIAGIRQAATSEETDPRGISRQAPDLKALAETGTNYSRMTPLTPREQEVMTLLAEGRTVREVASELALSIKTIEAHKLNLMRKLDIHNRASLVEYAARQGFIHAQPLAS